MRAFLGLAALAVLTACGGSGGSGVTNGPDVMGVNIPGGLVGRGFTANAARTEYDPANPTTYSFVDSYQGTVKFTSATTAMVSGISTSPVSLTYDAQAAGFVDASGDWFLGVYNTLDGVTTSTDMLYFFVYYRPTSGVQVLDSFVHGNRTAVSAMPSSGQASYAGSTWMVDGSIDPPVVGSFTLSADFANSLVSGQFTGILPSATSLAFDLVPVAINGNGFITGLTSVDPAVTVNGNSLANGRFFGPGAGEVGGTLVLDTSAGTASGVFGGSTP